MRTGRRSKTWCGPCSRAKNFCSATDMKTAWLLAMACCWGAVAPKAPVYSLAWRPDDSAIALGGYKEVRLVAGKAVIATLAGHAEAVRSVAFSRDGKLLA